LDVIKITDNKKEYKLLASEHQEILGSNKNTDNTCLITRPADVLPGHIVPIVSSNTSNIIPL
jgi:hypothetical protein